MRQTRVCKSELPGVIAFGAVACVLYGFGAGVRGDIGILMPALAIYTGTSYQDVSFCAAVMNLVFGATQPAFGMLAARRSNRFVLLCGVALIAASFAGMALSRSFAALLLSLGILFGSGAGAVAFGLVLSSAMRRVGPDRAMLISGMLNAAAGLGAFVLSPTLQGMLDAVGLARTMLVLLVPAAALVPIVFAVTSADPKAPGKNGGKGPTGLSDGEGAAKTLAGTTQTPEEQGSAKALERHGLDQAPEGRKLGQTSERQESKGLIARAFHDKTFLLLVAGFSTCGFHMVIIESHLFSQYVSYGIEASSASWAFSVYGIATILGALLSGWLSTRVPKGGLLVFYYGFRAVWTLAFLFLFPKSLAGALVFSIGLGLTGDATVSPTSGIVNSRYALTEAATLIGVLFFCHQIGGFLSAWLGGVLLEATGSYVVLWMLDAALCTVAAVASAFIRRR